MPLYEFQCPTCKKQVEELMKHSDPNPKCKACEVEMRKLISRTSFELLGGGWYKDGYSS